MMEVSQRSCVHTLTKEGNVVSSGEKENGEKMSVEVEVRASKEYFGNWLWRGQECQKLRFFEKSGVAPFSGMEKRQKCIESWHESVPACKYVTGKMQMCKYVIGKNCVSLWRRWGVQDVAYKGEECKMLRAKMVARSLRRCMMKMHAWRRVVVARRLK